MEGTYFTGTPDGYEHLKQHTSHKPERLCIGNQECIIPRKIKIKRTVEII
jgi:hypothetical protein